MSDQVIDNNQESAPQGADTTNQTEEFVNFSQFLADLPEEEQGDFDPNQIITIRSSAGGTFTVPTSEPMTIQALLERAELTTSPSIEYWVNGVVVGSDFVVAPGATVSAVGLIKGG
jgi:hypothetical protein